MTYGFVQVVQASANTSNSVASTPFAITPTLGNTLIIAYSYTRASQLATPTITDTVGKNTYHFITNTYDATTQVEVGFYYASSVDNSSTTYTVNYGTGVLRRGIAVFEYSGLDPSQAPLASNMHVNVNPGSGVNSSVSGTVTTSSPNPYLIWGHTTNISAIDTQSSTGGTGFTNRASIWTFGGSTSLGRFEDARSTTPNVNQQATFTPTTGTDTFMTSVILFAEAGFIHDYNLGLSLMTLGGSRP